jgi:hypothetical protein
VPQYMLLIYNPVDSPLSPEDQAAQQPRWGAFTQELHDAGLYVAGDALQRADVATTIRVRDGETQITDGPFAETREFLAGYYLLEADDLDTVIRFAEHTPNVGYGSVELRPVWDTTQTQQSAGQAAAQA